MERPYNFPDKVKDFVDEIVRTHSREEVNEILKGGEPLRKFISSATDVWLTDLFQTKLQWVERVHLDVDSNELNVEHSYPAGINIRDQIKDLIKLAYHGRSVVTLRLTKVTPSARTSSKGA